MIWVTDLQTSQRIKELVGEQKTIYYWYEYVNRPKWDDSDPFHLDYVGEEIAEDNPEEYNGRVIAAPAFTLSELAPVLKKIGEVKGWMCRCNICGGEQTSLKDENFKMCCEHWMYSFAMYGWLYHYLKTCELVGTGQEKEANQYLLELMK